MTRTHEQYHTFIALAPTQKDHAFKAMIPILWQHLRITACRRVRSPPLCRRLLRVCLHENVWKHRQGWRQLSDDQCTKPGHRRESRRPTIRAHTILPGEREEKTKSSSSQHLNFLALARIASERVCMLCFICCVDAEGGRPGLLLNVAACCVSFILLTRKGSGAVLVYGTWAENKTTILGQNN